MSDSRMRHGEVTRVATVPGATTVNRDAPFVSELIEDEADGRRADARERSLEVAAAERRGSLLEDVHARAVLLAASGLPRGADALLKVVGRPREDADPSPRPGGSCR